MFGVVVGDVCKVGIDRIIGTLGCTSLSSDNAKLAMALAASRA